MPKLKHHTIHGLRWNRMRAEATRLNISEEKLRELTRLANIRTLVIGSGTVLYDPDATDQALREYSERRVKGRGNA